VGLRKRVSLSDAAASPPSLTAPCVELTSWGREGWGAGAADDARGEARARRGGGGASRSSSSRSSSSSSSSGSSGSSGGDGVRARPRVRAARVPAVPLRVRPRAEGRTQRRRACPHCCAAMQKLRIVTCGGFGWEIAHAAVSRRPPIPLFAIVARTEGYTYVAKVWDLSIVQGPFFCRPVPNLNLNVTIRNFSIAVCWCHWQGSKAALGGIGQGLSSHSTTDRLPHHRSRRPCTRWGS
jgi:hypothetical protein